MRLLIVRLSSLGDVIHALPLAENARAAGAQVGWVVERAFAGALAGNPNCDEIFVADTRRWRRRPASPGTWREMRALAGRLRAFAPDRTIDVQGLWKSALVARAAGAPVVGFDASSRRELASAVLAGMRVAPAPEAVHIVDRNLALLEAAGIPVTVRAPDAAYLAAAGPGADAGFFETLDSPFAVLHPGAARPEKAWGEPRFAALARGLRERLGLRTVASWGPGDEARVERLRALDSETRIAPRLDLPGLARLARASALFVAGDTGPLHLADAAGATTLALFGPTDPARNGPYRNRGGVVTRMHDVSDETVLERAVARMRGER